MHAYRRSGANSMVRIRSLRRLAARAATLVREPTEAWMTDRDSTSARVHHAVFAVRPQSFEQASHYLERLGFRLVEHTLDDVGLRVRIDWAGGMEIVTPTEG